MESGAGESEARDELRGTSQSLETMGSQTSIQIPPEFKLELFVKKLDKYETAIYTDELGQIVAGFVAQNMSLSTIAQIPGMPSVLLVKQWIRREKSFAEIMKIAEEARAEVLADTALQVASDSKWQEAKSDKIKVDTALRLAAAYDPNKFASKSQVKSEHHETLTFFINTGFEHPGESRRLKPIDIEVRDPSTVLKEEHARDSHGVLPETGSDRTEETPPT